VMVSRINGCRYCADHHRAGMQRQMKADPEKFKAGDQELHKAEPGVPFTVAEQSALAYVGKLTREPGSITKSDVDRMREAGLSDGEILEVNQVASYFSYANRTVTGLGVSSEGELLGLAPDESEGWQHA
jgi:uncharacterized peroxidase-related enzyme